MAKKTKIWTMTPEKCIEMGCQWYNAYDKKCYLSGQFAKFEGFCFRYYQWKQRQKELQNK